MLSLLDFNVSPVRNLVSHMYLGFLGCIACSWTKGQRYKTVLILFDDNHLINTTAVSISEYATQAILINTPKFTGTTTQL